jgi:hypothetical protein
LSNLFRDFDIVNGDLSGICDDGRMLSKDDASIAELMRCP